MITRIVKLTIHPEKTEEFRTIFKENQSTIKRFEGCEHVELMCDIDSHNIFFTYSKWTSEHCLNDYRNSKIFEEIWKKTKKLFCAAPQAWSVNSVIPN